MINLLVLNRCDSAVLSGVALMLVACIVWLKLVSYAHTNYDMRALTKSLEKVCRAFKLAIKVFAINIFFSYKDNGCERELGIKNACLFVNVIYYSAFSL